MPDVRQLVTTAAVAVLAIAGYQAVHDTSPAPAAASSPHASGMLQPFMRFTGSGTTTMRPDQGTDLVLDPRHRRHPRATPRTRPARRCIR